MITNETKYAAYWGQACSSAAPRSAPGAFTETPMIKSVAGIAKMPSAKVSSREVSKALGGKSARRRTWDHAG
jgi:hypothetical protein